MTDYYGLGYRKPAQAYLTEWDVLVTTHCDPAFPYRGVDGGLDIPVYDPEAYAHLWAYDRAMAKRLLGLLSLEGYFVQSQFEVVRRQRTGERDANLGSVWESWGQYDDPEDGEEVSA